jgi:pentose-5-phosphate-3-epimerase
LDSYNKQAKAEVDLHLLIKENEEKINQIIQLRKNPLMVCEKSVDDLLDLLNMAKQMNDEIWINDLNEQLNMKTKKQ